MNGENRSSGPTCAEEQELQKNKNKNKLKRDTTRTC